MPRSRKRESAFAGIKAGDYVAVSLLISKTKGHYLRKVAFPFGTTIWSDCVFALLSKVNGLS